MKTEKELEIELLKLGKEFVKRFYDIIIKYKEDRFIDNVRNLVPGDFDSASQDVSEPPSAASQE